MEDTWNEAKVYEELGKDGIRNIVHSFYEQVKTDDLIGSMYPPDDWEGSETRLADFLLFRIGQDTKYILERGHPRLKMRHIHFKIGEPERDRWLAMMKTAMEENHVSPSSQLFLQNLFFQIADFMRNS